MTYTIHGLGWLPWEDVRTAIGDATCAWADFDGFHVGAVPDQAPPYSHVWAWAAGRWVRVRIDGAGGVVGVLEENGEGESIEIQERVADTWPAGDERVGPLPSDLTDRAARLLTTLEPLPITFVELFNAPDPTTPGAQAGT